MTKKEKKMYAWMPSNCELFHETYDSIEEAVKEALMPLIKEHLSFYMDMVGDHFNITYDVKTRKYTWQGKEYDSLPDAFKEEDGVVMSQEAMFLGENIGRIQKQAEEVSAKTELIKSGLVKPDVKIKKSLSSVLEMWAHRTWNERIGDLSLPPADLGVSGNGLPNGMLTYKDKEETK